MLICSFHHKLVHEYGWSLRRLRDGTVEWFHPDGTGYRAGPAPPESEESDVGRPNDRDLVLVGG